MSDTISPTPGDLSRRDFLGRSAKNAAGVAAGMVALAPSRVSSSPTERVAVGVIGVHRRGRELAGVLASRSDVDVPILCDVDPVVLGRAGDAITEAQGFAPEHVVDFRRLLDRVDLDAIVVATPDHWHATMVELACQAGKDVYVEKPASHNIREGKLMLEAARKYERVVQVGIQSRSSPHHADAYRYIESGKLGKVCWVTAWESTRQGSLGRPADGDPPQGVDYDTWLGPAPKRPFNRLRFHGNWRWFFDYGTGDLGNDGVHRLDFALRGLNAGRKAQGQEPVGLPTAVSASGGKFFFDDAQEFPDTLCVTYDYPGATMTYEMRIWSRPPYHGEHEGAVVYGENGYVVIGNGSWRAYNASGKPSGETSSSLNRTDMDPAHKRDFLSCIRSRKRPVCDIEIGHTTSVLCHAGNIAWRVGRKLRIDPSTHDFIDDPQANRLVTRKYREKWALPAVI